jgi:hypothetical protein
LRETEQDPFEDAADEEEEPQQSSSTSPKQKLGSSPPQSAASKSSSYAFGGTFTKSTSTKRPKKDKKGSKKSRPFNLEEEKPKMKTAIAESSVAATNLLNALQLINREYEQVSENATAVERFETCKMLRRHILRYVRLISDGLHHAY